MAAKGSRKNPYTLSEYNGIGSDSWTGGWVQESENYVIYRNRFKTVTYTGFCTKGNPVPGDLYNEMTQNHIWLGGWVLFGTIKKYVDSNDDEYNSTLGTQSDPCSMFIYNEMISNGIWEGGWVQDSNGQAHYMQNYGFVPPYILTKILTFGELSKLYGILKQEDRQSISKEFKLSDKLLKQILINLSMIRNICAHNDRLYSFHSKFLISYKKIDKNYECKANSTNIYIILKCMEYMLDYNNSKKLKEEIDNEIIKLEKSLNSIDINTVLSLMGFSENN